MLLLAACLLVVAAVEAILAELSASYFSSGFNGFYVDTVALVGGYFLLAAALDLFLILGMWAPLLPLLALLRATRLQVWCVAGMVALAVPLSLDIVRHNLHATLGKMASVSLLWTVSGESPSEMASEAYQQLPGLGLLLAALAGLGAVVVVLGARGIERRLADAGARFEPPRSRSLWIGFPTFGVIGALILTSSSPTANRLRYGVVRKPSAVVLGSIIERVTDVDRDGYGLLSAPRDRAPLDSSIHPYAVDIPGNGIDENSVGGDHPVGFEPVKVIEERSFRGDRTPHVLLVFLESFRADLIGKLWNGRELTPFLNRLAREGTFTRHAFAHSPYTRATRAQLFSGRLVPHPDQTTLIDDFKSRGYTVGHFSGQDDSFADSESLLGVERADVFYDARQDKDRRTSRSTSSVGLQISWKLLNRRVRSFLETCDPATPLFLYVNIVDTHFPYYHHELDAILDIEPISRRAIGADRASQVWETYANAVSNVDRAVERLVESWREWMGGADNAILVTADHGQEFYEEGFLGHGQSLKERQTRVPLILWGIGGEWPEPIGLADLRGLLRRNLSVERGEGVPRAHFVPDPRRSILQYIGKIERPKIIGLRGLGQTVIYDFGNDRRVVLGPDQTPLRLSEADERAAFEVLIWNWEAIQRRERAGAGSSG